jgi:hypothetical protein
MGKNTICLIGSLLFKAVVGNPQYVALKGIGSILFLKNGLNKNCRKKNVKIISEVIIMRYVQL